MSDTELCELEAKWERKAEMAKYEKRRHERWETRMKDKREHEESVFAGLMLVAALFGVFVLACWLTGLWVGDSRWGWTGLIMIVPALVMFGAACLYAEDKDL